jgi:hypothetical protein
MDISVEDSSLLICKTVLIIVQDGSRLFQNAGNYELTWYYIPEYWSFSTAVRMLDLVVCAHTRLCPVWFRFFIGQWSAKVTKKGHCPVFCTIPWKGATFCFVLLCFGLFWFVWFALALYSWQWLQCACNNIHEWGEVTARYSVNTLHVINLNLSWEWGFDNWKISHHSRKCNLTKIS